MRIMLRRKNRKSFLHRIITDDEKWIHYDNSEKRKSWVKPGQLTESTAKRNIFGSEVIH